METEAAIKEVTASEALRHPLRVRILGALNQVNISPVKFLQSGMGDGVPVLKGKPYESALSYVAYHFRVLAKAGCIEVIDTKVARGSVEHIYRAKARAEFDAEAWEKLDLDERVEISRVTAQSFIAQVDSALLSGTFEKRPDRWISWLPLKLDERAWKRLVSVMENCWEEVEELKDEAATRLAASETEPIPATFGILGFESPPIPNGID